MTRPSPSNTAETIPDNEAGDEYAQGRLKPICPQCIGSFLETARHIAKRVFSKSKNRRHSHQREQATCGEHVESLADWKERHPLHERGT